MSDRPAPLTSLSAIIPLHADGAGIGNLLRAVRGARLLGEILVVDCVGSDAGFAEVQYASALDSRIRYMRVKPRCGKRAGLYVGACRARGRWLLVLEPGQHYLSPEHVEALVRPVYHDQTDMTIGAYDDERVPAASPHPPLPWTSTPCCLTRTRFFTIAEARVARQRLTYHSLTGRTATWRCRYVALAGAVPEPDLIASV